YTPLFRSGGGASRDLGACSGLRVDVPGTGPRHSPFLADDARGARGRKTIYFAVGGDPGGGQTPLFADDRGPDRQASLPVDDAGSTGGRKPTFFANDTCRTRRRQASLFANDGRTRWAQTPLLADHSHCRGRQPTFLTDHTRGPRRRQPPLLADDGRRGRTQHGADDRDDLGHARDLAHDLLDLFAVAQRQLRRNDADGAALGADRDPRGAALAGLS